MGKYFNRPGILRSPPVKRAAYSDRTAWLMAEICHLVYEPLPDEMTVAALVTEIRDAVAKGAEDSALSALVSRAVAAGTENRAGIQGELQAAGFKLLDGFAVDGTEGVVVELGGADGPDGMLVVAFRGTQPSIADVVTDLRANLVPARGGGRVHAGFLEAFDRIATRLGQVLASRPGLPVYMAGHSLGGALALVATRYLDSDGTGATYTFGGPRVADDKFFERLKTPIYRVVNAADGVPRIPFGYSLSILLAALRIIPVNGTRWLSEYLRRNFLGYTHPGHLVMLAPRATPRKGEQERDSAAGLVRQSPDIFWRVATVVWRWLSTRGRALVSDHSIAQYALKLGDYAEYRNRL